MKTLLLITISLSLFSCASTEPEKFKNPFDAITLKEKIIQGKTSQTEILETFGAPEITTTSDSNEDIWTYVKTSHESESNGVNADVLAVFLPASLYAIGGGVNHNKSESSNKNTSVIIKFNKNKIVKSYSISKTRI